MGLKSRPGRVAGGHVSSGRFQRELEQYFGRLKKRRKVSRSPTSSHAHLPRTLTRELAALEALHASYELPNLCGLQVGSFVTKPAEVDLETADDVRRAEWFHEAVGSRWLAGARCSRPGLRARGEPITGCITSLGTILVLAGSRKKQVCFRSEDGGATFSKSNVLGCRPAHDASAAGRQGDRGRHCRSGCRLPRRRPQLPTGGGSERLARGR